MRRISYSHLAFAALTVGLLASSAAFAGDGRTCPGNTPNPNGANIALRVFNDCPTSTVSFTNSYPASIIISDTNNDCFGFTNLHTWSFSTDGGLTEAQFENCSYYHFCADVSADGDGNGELGLRLSPWFGGDTDGKFMLNLGGEIACFGGRLPFYSFTGNYGIHYTRGSVVHMDVVYNPHSLLASDPATITYSVTIGPNTYSSGPLAFDEGNPTEDPPHGLWGELVPAYAGGYFQPNSGHGIPVGLVATFSKICYENLGATPTVKSTWGRVKSLYR
jgi:hypothetical protein